MRAQFKDRVLRSLSAILLALACGLAGAQDAPASGQEASARGNDVARIIGGIVNFTQWPDAPRKLRLCITTPAAYADVLVRNMSAAEQLASVQYLEPEDTRLDSDCDVVYIEHANQADRAHLFQRLAGHPVLSIAGSASGCLMGSLFCFSGTSAPARFSANLDTIARSRLRINPKVLLLAHPQQAK